MILDPTGRPTSSHTIPLSSEAIRALVDGHHFVAGMGPDRVLSSVQLEPCCAVCVASGHSGDIRTMRYVDRVDFNCGHVAGFIRRDRGPLDVEPLLKSLQWGLRCSHCKGAVHGDNSKADTVFRVACGCTVREKVNPIALAPRPQELVGHSRPVILT